MIKNILGVAIAATLLGSGLPAFANDGSVDAFPPAQQIVYQHMPGPDMAADGSAVPAGATTYQYLFLAGSAFTPRNSSQTVTYPGSGCTASNQAVTTSLELPQGASILGVRLYYYNSGSSSDVSLFLTVYPGDGSSSDRLVGNSIQNIGYASDYLNLPTPLSVDNYSQAYMLTGLTTGPTRLCGMRVFYEH